MKWEMNMLKDFMHRFCKKKTSQFFYIILLNNLNLFIFLAVKRQYEKLLAVMSGKRCKEASVETSAPSF